MNDKNYMYLYIGCKAGFVEKHLVDGRHGPVVFFDGNF